MTAPITLTWSEVMTAGMVGFRRQVTALRDQRRDVHGWDQDKWKTHIEGACAEMALAKHLGLFWSCNVGRVDASDLGLIEVKSTPLEHGSLILNPHHADDKAFVLMIGEVPRFRPVGWIVGRDGKNPQWWRDPHGELRGFKRPAFFVPQAALTPMPALKSWLREHSRLEA